MDPLRNPFAPGAGFPPPELAGRDQILQDVEISCARAILGRNARSFMLLGLRGTGKTVLLNKIGDNAETRGFLISKIEAPENENLPHLIYPELQRVLRTLSNMEAAKNAAHQGLRGLRNFASIFEIKIAGLEVGVKPDPAPKQGSEPGLADSGNLEFDLPAIFEAIGRAAKAAQKGWIILLDEVQYLSKEDLAALIVSIHKMSQLQLPVIFVGAGLPQVARLAGEAKSYAERLFLFPKVKALDPQSSADAIIKPILEEEASIHPSAVEFIIKKTNGYPFFLQEWASNAWNIAVGPQISLEDVNASYKQTISSLDESFFQVRLDRLTKSEIRFVKTMASLGDGPYAMADIAKLYDRTPQSLGPTRNTIIHKGMIYSTEPGWIDFTVPLFADYLRRQS